MVKARKKPSDKVESTKILVPVLIGLALAFIMPAKAIWILVPAVVIIGLYFRSKWPKVWKCPKCGYHFEKM
jgi:hypothetical protein